MGQAMAAALHPAAAPAAAAPAAAAVAGATKFCIACGHSIPGHAAFCPDCGKPQ